jgi:hypothetical protein
VLGGGEPAPVVDSGSGGVNSGGANSGGDANAVKGTGRAAEVPDLVGTDEVAGEKRKRMPSR